MKNQKHAFSLIEISVVLIIVGIFVAGIFASNSFITKARLAAAQSLLKSSPIRDIKDNALWLETSALDSFTGSEASDGTPLTTWYEQRSNTGKVTLTAVDGGPTYSNTINRIHAVKFTGAGYFNFDGSFLNNTDYTITILEKREASGGNNYFLGDSATTTTNQSLLLGYSADGQIMHSQGASSSYSALVSGYSSSSDNPRILTFTHSSTAGKKLYINGVLAAKDETNLAPLTGIGTLSFGKGYRGQIGELAIFTRAIDEDEIKSVEGYVAQKFSSKLVDKASAADCLGKVVTTSGCEVASGGGGASSTCAVSVVGVTSTTPVADGSGTLTCNATGYTGTSAYTCASGTLSAAACACDTANGYSLSGGVCVLAAPCTGGIETTIGSDKMHAFTSSGTLTCTGAITGAKVLVVGGGGGGGGVVGGGGGAGGVVYNPSYALGASSYSITVGVRGRGGKAGGNGSDEGGYKGTDSVFDVNSVTKKITAAAGGAGRANIMQTYVGTGGSGGGASISGGPSAGVAGQGFAGGDSSDRSNLGGGGGGAGSVGALGTAGKGGNGGAGVDYSSVFGTSYGDNGWFASGGGGGVRTGSGSIAGTASQGGGTGGTTSTVAAADARANTGGGGGGAGFSGDLSGLYAGGDGGSGIVIVRYPR